MLYLHGLSAQRLTLPIPSRATINHKAKVLKVTLEYNKDLKEFLTVVKLRLIGKREEREQRTINQYFDRERLEEWQGLEGSSIDVEAKFSLQNLKNPKLQNSSSLLSAHIFLSICLISSEEVL
jgi:hypothetical protein